MKDFWSQSEEYRRQFQTPDEIETILGLLELDRASALADIGCGNGTFAIAVARRFPSCRVWAFDVLDSAVQACRRAAEDLVHANLRIGIARAQAIPLPERSVDRLLCRAVLHHLPDPESAYAQVSRILRPGGLLVLQTPCNYWEGTFGQTISELYHLMDDSHPRFYHQPGAIMNGLADAGFGIRRAECWPYEFRDLNAAQVQFLRDRGAAERVRLRQMPEGGWSVELYWMRVVAVRE
jgi:ubiquinone/menaquinone biosynthesis C-methylase UbiE